MKTFFSLPFDVDLEDKSGSNTAVMVRNVTMTPYGSAHFTGNSALTLLETGSSWIGGSSSSGGFSGQRVNSAFGEGWSNMLFGGPSDSHSGESSSGGSSTESLDSILKSLSNGFAGGSGTSSIQDSQEYYSGGFGMGDMFGLLAAEEFLRKKRSTDNVVRHKRQAHAPFHYQSLVGNCHGNNPSIDIAANERNVKMILVTDGSNQPGELILPIVQGWNEVTLVYNGRDMHGMVNNWQGEKKTSIPMRGNIQSRPEGISLGYCPKYDGLQGKIDDFAFYECIPLAIQNKIGRS